MDVIIIISFPLLMMYGRDSFHICLKSDVDLNEFETNSVIGFTNKIIPQIDLNAEYEVAVKNIIFKEKFYQIPKKDVRFSIFIHVGYINKYGLKDTISMHYVAQEAISVCNIIELVKEINKDFEKALLKRNIINQNVQPIFQIKSGSSFIEFNEIKLDDEIFHTYNILWHIGPKLRKIFGFQSRVFINTPVIDKEAYFPRKDSFIKIYSDLINAGQFANKNLNILDILPATNMYSKSGTSLCYKSINKKNIDTISVSLMNEDDLPISLCDEVVITIILSFRKKGLEYSMGRSAARLS